jgi:hypothetical protein
MYVILFTQTRNKTEVPCVYGTYNYRCNVAKLNELVDKLNKTPCAPDGGAPWPDCSNYRLIAMAEADDPTMQIADFELTAQLNNIRFINKE